jgi:hypothetical protein
MPAMARRATAGRISGPAAAMFSTDRKPMFKCFKTEP